MRKTYIFILTHGLWGQELIKSTEMVIGGNISDIRAFPLMPEMSLAKYQAAIESTIKELPDFDILFLVDILGGTPYNISACFTQTHRQIEAISGLSMDLLITALDLRQQLPCSEIPAHLISHFEHMGNYITDLKQLLE